MDKTPTPLASRPGRRPAMRDTATPPALHSQPGDDINRIFCRYCGDRVEPIESLVDGERWWRCPQCAALLDKTEGRRP
jgi:hypothetical protein